METTLEGSYFEATTFEGSSLETISFEATSLGATSFDGKGTTFSFCRSYSYLASLPLERTWDRKWDNMSHRN